MLKSILRKTTAVGIMAVASLLFQETIGSSRASAKDVLRTDLVCRGGNPGVEAFARMDDQSKVELVVENLDPNLFPEGNICQTEVEVGGLQARGLPLEMEGIFTELHFTQQPALVAAGNRAKARIR